MGRSNRDVFSATYRIGNVGSGAIVQQGTGNTVNYFADGAGIEELLCTPQEFIAGMQEEQTSFHHCWPLIGRADIFEQFHAFVDDPGSRLLLLKGPPGVGKTKLLYAFANALQEQHSPWVPFFVNRGAVGRAASQLPDNPVVILADGPYTRTASALLGDVSKRPLKVIFAVDLSDAQELRGALRGFAQGLEQRREIELLPLDREAAHGLAEVALGETERGAAAQLAVATGGNPLLITLAAWLMTHRQIALQSLATDRDFRREVTDNFCHILTGESPDKEKLLQLLALLSPVRWDLPIQQRVREFLPLAAADLHSHIDAFQALGAVHRTGKFIFLAPDVIADEYLQRACLSRDGSLDLYPQEVFRAFQDLWPSGLLRNVMRLDWRLNRPENEPLEAMLSYLEDRIRLREHFPDLHMVDLLQDLARYQPRRCFPLLNALAEEAQQWNVSDVDVMQLSETLFDVSREDDLLADCCELLWRLGRDDPFTFLPDHPFHLLADLVSLRPGIPVARNLIVLERIRTWLRSAENHLNSPLELLEDFFESIFEFDAVQQATAAIERALSILQDHISSRGNESERTVDCLGRYLTYPEVKGLGSAWQQEKKKAILNFLGREMRTADEPFGGLIRKALITVKHHSPSRAVRTGATAALEDPTTQP